MTIDLSTIQAIVGFSLDEAVACGHIACFIVGAPAETSGLFANAVPASQAQATMIAAEIHSAITLDWAASGKKSPRIYQIAIKDRDKNIRTERRIACAPEETRPEDALGAAVNVGVACLAAASSAMQAPQKELREIIEFQKGLMDRDRAEIQSLRDRNRVLEMERSGAVDTLVAYMKNENEGRLHGAQAEAALIEAKAKAGMYKDLGQSAMINAPTLLKIGAHIAGLRMDRPPPGLAKAAMGLAAAAPGLMAAMTGSPPSSTTTGPSPGASSETPLSPEAIRAVREVAAKLTDEEIVRLVRWAYFAASSETIGKGIGQLNPENQAAAVGLVRLLPEDWNR